MRGTGATNEDNEFFNDISHALQNPLTILRGSLELLMSDASSIPPSKIYASMEHSVSTLSQLVTSLLNLARAGTETDSGKAQVVRLDRVLDRIIECASITAEAKDVQLYCEKLDPAYVQGEEFYLEEAFSNILSNAIKYTAGAARREVRIAVQQVQDTHRITVTDTGIGMNPEQLARLGTRFYRAHTGSASPEGTGLGFAITKRIIERHGGALDISSMEGVGTTIQISIPAAASEDALAQEVL